MITEWQIYWITRLDSIGCILGGAIAIMALFLLVTGISWIISSGSSYGQDDDWRRGQAAKMYFFKCLYFIWIPCVIAVFIPSTKEMAAIIIIPKIVNGVAGNKAIQELPNNVVDLANEWLKELKPKKLDAEK